MGPETLILFTIYSDGGKQIKGVVTSLTAAEAWRERSTSNHWMRVTIDDPAIYYLLGVPLPDADGPPDNQARAAGN